MENLHGSSRVPKVTQGNLIGGGSFENADLGSGDSPLLRYLLGGSQSPVGGGFKQRRHPISPVDNLMAAARSPTAYRTPVRAVPRDDVLVMDGVLITDGKRSSSRSGGSSGSPSSASSESSGKSLYKGQFLLGKENLRPTRFPGKNKSELCKSTPRSGSCAPSPKSRLVYQIMASAVTEAVAAVTSSPKLKRTSETPITAICCGDWSPQDDGIEVSLPSSTEKLPSKADVDEYITASLYGPTTRRRLPVFDEISQRTDLIAQRKLPFHTKGLLWAVS
ncbi:uncharacterized protein LOC126793715 isoform X2 [Argentina anserina]|uniref:uncharacterized protein LOC126793715 isoform X2 n=1 Tax=Argentina anserina TaxID=57926 RepID=UPI00217626F8|nr:uncharacterized protein LOC126793715 isoform X2 [Potentilla anserina]